MSNPFLESTNREVLYPDDLPDVGRFEVIGDQPEPAENVDHEEAQYGQWVRIAVSDPEPREAWAAAPEGLRDFIGTAMAEHGTDADLIIEVTEVTEGELEHDPYEIGARVHSVDGEKVDE